MCGIAGIVSYSPDFNIKESIIPMLNEIKHRGPDDEGCVFISDSKSTPTFGIDTPLEVRNSSLPYSPSLDINSFTDSSKTVLGHRRLSILDLSEHAHQPMCNETENYWIVFNGEIYNYKEIRTELIEKGHQFTSNSDTEVVLKAFIEWGKNCLSKFNGMWSFVIYNKTTKKLFGARDRFGVKPFYYIKNENHFAFCSEIKGLLKIEGFKKKINPNAVYDFLISSKLEIDDETFFKGIFELKPSSLFELDTVSRKFTTEKYYTLSYNKKWESINPTELPNVIADIKQKVINAVDIRLNADVKTGSCLSGGIDSSAIVTTINQLLKEKEINPIGKEQEVFTASYPNTSIDESEWAQIVVDKTKTNWNQTFPDAKSIEQQLTDLVYAQDIPFGSSTSFSQFKVMELIHQKGVKVSIDGQGADELFAGYPNHYASSIVNGMKSFSILAVLKNLKAKDGTFSNHSQILKLPLQSLYIQLFPNSYFGKLKVKQPELAYIKPNFLKENKNRLVLINDKFKSNLNNLLHYQFTDCGLKQLLRTADRSSMHFSVETRMPFVDDNDLVETVFNISGKPKIKDGKSKFLLREAMKGLLPEEIYNRTDKLGFSTPEKQWFAALKPYLKSILAEQKNDEFVNWEEMDKNFDVLYENALNTNISRFWRFIIFALWRKVYNV
ncbi:MAG: asparagine synthase (glutamine-hydrolyzing) [Vicingaceae bacterium]|nr:asparagine synthase (glutamine-hydrolyzing) [Vicingaceae bacterium]